MTDVDRPAPHPRPRPQPAAPEPEAAAASAQPPAARRTLDIRADLAPAVRDEVEGLSRAERRKADKDAGRQVRLRWALQIAGGVLAAVAVVAIVLALTGNGSSPDRRSSSTPAATATGANLADPGAVSAFLGAAGSDVAAVTTYDYRHLDDALSAGLAVTTGQYREAFRAALTGDLARTATAEHVIHTFEQLDAGIGMVNAAGTVAKVLVFGRQRITDERTGPHTQVVPVTLCATIRRDGNRYRISDLVEGADPGLPPGGPDLPVAAEAARAEVVSLLSRRRAEFAADLQRALDGATSPLREQLGRAAERTKNAMVKGEYDTTGTVTALAVVRADAETVTLLVAADESRRVDGSTEPTVTHQRYEVTVTHTLDGWAASRISSVDGGG